jgi:hypothetical protein
MSEMAIARLETIVDARRDDLSRLTETVVQEKVLPTESFALDYP